MRFEEADRWLEIRNAFDAAADLDGLARNELLEQIAATDLELAEEVRSLLLASSENPDFLERPPVIPMLPAAPAAGFQVGPFRLDRPLGEGGMGMVFLAHRDDGAFEQTVAVKFVRSGLSGEQLQRRFEFERSILASLNHPNIARLYDGGVTADGWPYLVMEYVEGQAITKYCADVGASVEERIELLQSVCRTVQYAHQNLVVHRDLKPSNILVTPDGTVKLLDFGVGKILAPQEDLTEGPGGPATLAFALTPSYSAPEQLRGEPVTTSVDIYALGTIAYEMVAGSRPFDLRGLDLAQAERRVREEQPAPPSHALEALRSDYGETFSGVVDADLDTVILKALRKEPSHRYASANALADDLGRYLAGLPVAARDPTLPYRATKFVRRNRVRVLAASIVSLLFATAAVGTVWQARVATASGEQARAALAQAQAAAERTQRVNDFLQRILQTPNPSWYVENERKGPEVTVLEALVDAAGRIEIDLADDPGIQADIHHTLGDTYRALGQWDAMTPHFERALAIRSAHFTAPHPKIAESLFYMAAAESYRGDMVASDSLIRAAIDMQRARDEGNNLPYMLAHLSSSLEFEGRFSEAIAAQVDAAENAEARWGSEHPTTVFLRADLARQLVVSGEREAGMNLVGALGPRPDLPPAHAVLAKAYAAAGASESMEQMVRSLDPSLREGILAFALEREVLIPQGHLEDAQERLDAVLHPTDGHLAPLSPHVVLKGLGLSSRVARLRGEIERAERELDKMDVILLDREQAGQGAFFWAERRLARAERAALEQGRGRFEEAERLLMANLKECNGALGSKAHLEETRTQLADLSRAQDMDRP